MTRINLPSSAKHALKFLGLVSILLIYSSNKKAANEPFNKGHWLLDYDQAINKAKVENKPLLIFFTDSDWCKPCIKLKKEVFEDENFKSYASENLVLLQLDFPRYKKDNLMVTPTSHNESTVSQSDGERNFPLVLLMSKEGRIISRTGYRDGGAQAFLSYLQESLIHYN